MEIREPPTKITPLPTRLEVTICVLLDAKNSSRDHQSKHTNISSIWKFVSYILNFTYMQSIYIHTHIYIYTIFASKTSATKKTEIIHPSNFLESVATRWAVRSSDLRHSGFLHLRSIILQLDGSILSQLSTGKDPADVLKTVIPLWLFFLLKGGSDFGGCFLLSCSWFLWSCVDLGRFFFGCELFLRWLDGCLVKLLHVWSLLSLVNLLGIFIGFGDLLLNLLDY